MYESDGAEGETLLINIREKVFCVLLSFGRSFHLTNALQLDSLYTIVPDLIDVTSPLLKSVS